MKSKQNDRIQELRQRMESMLADAKAGKYVAPNRVNGTPNYNFSELTNSVTVYASL
jgi:hypothetical protein